MSNGNKEILLSILNKEGAWTFLDEVVKGVNRPKEFRSESAAQREGSMMLKEGQVDSYKVYKLLSEHH